MEYLIEHMKGVLMFWQIVFYIVTFIMICITIGYANTERLDIEELAEKHKFLLFATIAPAVAGIILTTIYLFLYA